MNSISFSRIFLLIETILRTNRSRICNLAIVYSSILTLFFILSYILKGNLLGFMGIVAPCYFIFAVCATSYFSIYSKKKYMITTYLLPASRTEKFIANILLSGVIAPAIFMLISSVLVSIFWLIALTKDPNIDYITSLKTVVPSLQITTLLVLYATGAVSGVFFRKSHYMGFLYLAGLSAIYSIVAVFVYDFTANVEVHNIKTEIPESVQIAYVVVMLLLSFYLFKRKELR